MPDETPSVPKVPGLTWLVGLVIAAAFLTSMGMAFVLQQQHPEPAFQIPAWLNAIQVAALPALLAWLAPSPISTPPSATLQKVDRQTEILSTQLTNVQAALPPAAPVPPVPPGASGEQPPPPPPDDPPPPAPPVAEPVVEGAPA